MAFGKTTDARTHTLGDLLMVTGTFTDGGTEVDYSQFLNTVYAAGAHMTSITDTGVKVNNGNVAAGDTVLTVDTVAARPTFTAGQTVYNSAGVRLGIIASVDSDTQITLAAPGLTVGHANNENYYVLGAHKPSITLLSTSVDASIDETNKLVLFECGNRSETSTASVEDGRWWILGER